MIINENEISSMANGGAGYSRGGPQTGMMDQHNRSFGTFNQQQEDQNSLKDS
jgi:hypothetical protein